VTSESGTMGGTDAFSLQLNTNFFTTATCSGALNPSQCRGWQQFVDSNVEGQAAYMQYWLINYGTTICPAGWTSYIAGSDKDCYTNSDAVPVPVQPISNLANLSVTGQAVVGDVDTLVLSTGTTLYAVQNSDSVVNLAQGWTIAEFNVVGDCCSSQANFNIGSSIVVRTSIDSGVATAPSCYGGGFTAETNNLNFQPSSGTPRSSTQPAIVFTQGSNATSAPPCQSAVAVPAASKLADTHDSNGDGFSDIVWRSGGDIAIWLMSGAEVMQSGAAGTVSGTWSIVGQRYFNGDGTYDLLWGDGSGDMSIWFMIGTQAFSSAPVGNVPIGWSVAGVADFNGDGKGDLLWRDASGNTAVWLMNGASVLSTGSLGDVPTTWSVAGTGDFNGDGYADILWRDTSGNTSIWFMNGTTVLSVGAVGNVSTTWAVVGTGDFNADGMTDIVWRDTTGDTSVWLMNAASGCCPPATSAPYRRPGLCR
jgi:FG-GAP-like repeat